MQDTLMGPVILDVEGLMLSAEEHEILSHPHVGGVIFFSRNFENPEQLAQLAKTIKSVRPNCLLCVDQEGGRVQRFKNGLTRLPYLRLLGELIDRKEHSLAQVINFSEDLGFLMALEVLSLGVDLSFAPVLDLDKNLSEVIGNRAFHRDPAMVSSLASAYIIGMRKAGMQATGKHFPGHGSVTLDSHLALPEDGRSLTEIAQDIAPFQALIQQNIAAIMPAHIVYPKIDQYPVGFSPFWLQSILRQQLGFQGAIISDDLSMGGAEVMGDYPERANAAIKAGCDFILVCNQRQGAIEILEKLSERQDPLSLQRRRNMLARECGVPSWSQLSQSIAWQKALGAIEDMQRNSLLEI